MNNVWNLEWLNHNSQRSYPIADWATKKCNTDESIVLQDDFILALSMGISTEHTLDIEKFYIKTVQVSETGCGIIIGYEDTPVGITFVRQGTDITTSSITGLDGFEDIVGYIAVNPQSEIFKYLPGEYTFDWAGSALEPDCIRPMIQSIVSFQVKGGTTRYGDIIFREGANVRLTSNNGTLIFTAVNPDGFVRKCDCSEDNTNNRPIVSINGVYPDEEGNLELISENEAEIKTGRENPGKECVQLVNELNKIILDDTCSTPCCGCVEINALYQNLKDALDGAATMNRVLNELSNKQAQIELTYSTAYKNRFKCECENLSKTDGSMDDKLRYKVIKYHYHPNTYKPIANIVATTVSYYSYEMLRVDQEPQFSTGTTVQDVNGKEFTIMKVEELRRFNYWNPDENEDLYEVEPEKFGSTWQKKRNVEFGKFYREEKIV